MTTATPTLWSIEAPYTTVPPIAALPKILTPQAMARPRPSGERDDSWISKEKSVCGGDACIRSTRIPVWVLINYLRLGGTDDDLLRDYSSSLTAADLQAAKDYYEVKRDEIDRAIRRNEEGEEGLAE